MNKTLLSKLAIAGLGAMIIAPGAAYAADGTINIKGTVTSTTCKVSNGSPAGTIAVNLPSVGTSAFKAPGDIAGTTSFPITVSGCGAAETPTVSVGFETAGVKINKTNGALQNTGTAPGVDAIGVDVRLLDPATGSPINLALTTGQGGPTAKVTSGGATLTYAAQYIANAATVTAGAVNATIQYTMQYQ